jgi:Heparinase II/III-like protein
VGCGQTSGFGGVRDGMSAIGRWVGRVWVAWWLGVGMVGAAGLADEAHPRLWLRRGGEEVVRRSVAADPLAAALHRASMKIADEVLGERVCRYEIPDGKRLLGESRRALRAVLHGAWAWRIERSEKHRLRAVAELEAACGLKDWNPSHFLDVAEMATAVAVGYDWLYDTLTPEQRRMCERALVEKALKPAESSAARAGWWKRPSNNWSQVCGAGIALASIAVAGSDEGGRSERLFRDGLKLVEDCAVFYQPDGMYPEGPAYWHYGTNYHVMLLAACEALGMRPKVDASLRGGGAAIMHLTGPSGLSFNFADADVAMETPSPAQAWLARKFGDGAQSAHVRRLLERRLAADGRGAGRLRPDRYFCLTLPWLPAAPAGGGAASTAAVYRGEQPVASFRTGWDAQAAWLAIKGGTAAASHGHMDAGSFILEAAGRRWIHDLGKENYNLPGYFGGKRWEYYRLQNRSHNTLEIGGRLHDAKSKPCPLIASSTTGSIDSAVFDLSSAFSGSAAKVVRSVRFDRRSGISRIRDEVEAPVGDVVWRAFTDADARVDGDAVVLAADRKQFRLRRVSGAGVWSVTPDAKPPGQGENPNQGFRAVVLTVPRADRLAIEVELRP